MVSLETVTIGNPGNAADPATGSLYGAVSYAYDIAKYETTVSQYAEFLNAVAQTDSYGLYSPNMNLFYIDGITQTGTSGSFSYSVASGSGNKPVTFVSWFDAARFANWIHNGQPTGLQNASTTEDGAYRRPEPSAAWRFQRMWEPPFDSDPGRVGQGRLL